MGFFMILYLPSGKSNEVTYETKEGILCSERGLSEAASCAITVRA